MLPQNWSMGRLALKVMDDKKSARFRDKDVDVHNAGDATKCGRQLTYKALKTPESNPTDTLGKFRMRFGSWLERGLVYEIFGTKMSQFNVRQVTTQGDCGEHSSFYETSWHGYRDLDIEYTTPEEKTKQIIVEIKTKVGYGAVATLKKTAWSKEFVIPTPDQEWGYSQQLSLYLRDAYNKTKDNPHYDIPVTDGILLQLLYGDGIACFVEYYFEYHPENDTCVCYRVHCEEYPECSSPLNIVINLKDIADHWKATDTYLREGTLAPPDFKRRYDINDERVQNATKATLEKAIKNNKLIGDVQCAYCSFRDKCAEDLGIPLTYDEADKKVLKSIVKNR